jgi:hypothetical protein
VIFVINVNEGTAIMEKRRRHVPALKKHEKSALMALDINGQYLIINT